MSRLSTSGLIQLRKRQHGFKGENSDVFCHEGDMLNRRQRRRLAALQKQNKGEQPFFIGSN